MVCPGLLLLGREGGEEQHSPGVQILRVGGVQGPFGGASSGQGAGFSQEQRRISSSEAWLDSGGNSCVYDQDD